jgi:hypothetical protein
MPADREREIRALRDSAMMHPLVRTALDDALAELDRLRGDLTRAKAVCIAYQTGLDYDDDQGVWYDEGGAVICLDEHLVQWYESAVTVRAGIDRARSTPGGET